MDEEILMFEERKEVETDDYFDDDPFKNFGEDMGNEDTFSDEISMENI